MAKSKRKCLQCKEFEPVENGIACNLGFFCCDNCRKQYGINKATKLASKPRVKREKENKQAVRDLNRKTVKWQHTHTQIAFNKMRVLEEKIWFYEQDQEPQCISCGKKNMDWCCGHFKTRKAQGNLRYDRNNTFLQCNNYCNKHLSGNIEGSKTTRGYKVGLTERFGAADASHIIEYCESNTQTKKWTWQELEEMRKVFNEKIRGLEKELLLWNS